MVDNEFSAETSDAAGAGVAAGGGWIRGEGCGAKAPPTSFNGYQSTSQSECVLQDGLFVHPEDKVRGLNSLLLNNDTHSLSLMNNITAGGVSASSYGSAGSVNGSVNDSGNKLDSVLAHWDYGNPGRIVKKRPPSNKNSSSSRSSGRDRYSKNNLHGHKFVNSKIPYHKKADAVDELAWTFGQTEMMIDRTHGIPLSDVDGVGPSSTLHPHPHFLHPLEERANEKGGPASIHTHCMPSPASVNPVTPLSVSNALTPKQCGPGSVPPSSIASQSARTPGDPASLRSPYPHTLSNGPLTPAMDTENKLGPTTPKSIGGPPSCGPTVPPLGSPFGQRGKNVNTVPMGPLSAGTVNNVDRKPDVMTFKSEQQISSYQTHHQQTMYGQANGPFTFSNTQNSNHHPSGPSQVTNAYSSFFKNEIEYSTNQEKKMVQINPQNSYKRPALPCKEYENELHRTQITLSDSIYNSSSMQDWLNHPVRKYRKMEKINQKSGGTIEVPKKPLYRRKSQSDLLNLSYAINGHISSVLLNGVKSDPDSNQCNGNIDASIPIKSEKESMSMEYTVGSTSIKPDETIDIDSKNKISDDDLYTEAGIKPSMNDLDNLFESDDSDGNVPPSSETPPSSVPNAGTGNINHEDTMINDNNCSNFTKIKTLPPISQSNVPSTRIDPTGNLPHDQLSKMFPTPPSHEHNPIASPADGEMGVDPMSVHSSIGNNMLKHEQPNSPITDQMVMDVSFGGSMEDAALMLSSTKFAAIDLPIMELKSSKLNPFELKYRASNQSFGGSNNAVTEGINSDHHGNHPNLASHLQAHNYGPGSVAHGTTAIKSGMSPISPMPPSPRFGGPRSQQQAGPNHLQLDSSNTVSSPASVSMPPNTCKVMSGPSSSQSGKYSSNSVKKPGISPFGLEIIQGPEANSLAINLVLSDSLLNVFRDHNFDSCTMCVCSNDGNIRGRDAAKYLPPATDNNAQSEAHDCPNCQCGFSAVINRKLSYHSGLFYEDETEITNINEDPYQRKKHSLLIVNGEGEDNAALTESGEASDFASKSAEVDTIPNSLLELIHKQYSLSNLSLAQNALLKCSDQYLRQLASQSPSTLSLVEMMDSNYVISSALEPSNKNNDDENRKTAKSNISKRDCVHKWTLLNAPGPYCSEDIMRVMKSLQPILNASLHVRKTFEKIKIGGQSKSGHNKSQPDISSTLSVQGPLTWRQFHRMAGPLTKGNTDDSPSPLPIPAITVGHEKDFITVSPLALHFWESLSLEPFSQPRDVAYIVIAPENDFLNVKVKTFFKNLSSTYEVRTHYFFK